MCDKAFLYSTNEENELIKDGQAIYRNDVDITEDRYSRITFFIDGKNTNQPLAELNMEEELLNVEYKEAMEEEVPSPQYMPDYSPPDSPVRSPVYSLWNPEPYSPSAIPDYEEPYSPYLSYNSPSYEPYSPSPIVEYDTMNLKEINSEEYQPMELQENIEPHIDQPIENQPIELLENNDTSINQPIEIEEIQPTENKQMENHQAEDEVIFIERRLKLPVKRVSEQEDIIRIEINLARCAKIRGGHLLRLNKRK